MGRLSLSKLVCIVFVFCASAAIVSPAQTFTSLFSFDLADGANSWAGLVQGADGNFYGTAYTGGAYGYGTVFRITATGTLTTLYSFCSAGWPSCPDGAYPLAAPVQATNGNFYGTTADGGSNGCGTVFKITAGGTLTTLHSFDCTEGEYPSSGGLLQATDGNFYGTTLFGGTYTDGAVFKITPAGQLTTLHSFCSAGLPNCPDGANPAGGLVQARDGNFYGTTDTGGANGYGTVFKVTPAGTLTTLHSFDLTDGNMPVGTMVQANDGSFYGVTTWGGANYPAECTNGQQTGCGTVFKITAAGTLTTLHSFDFVGDGLCPNAGLVLATDGNFYGTTSYGGANGYSSYGTVFNISPGGALTTLHSFDLTDGANASAVLLQATNGSFYGTTEEGGTSTKCTLDCGTIFSLSVGLSAFPRVTFSTTSLSFGNEVVDDTSAAKTVTVTNTGSATLDISSITVSTNFAISANTCGATLAVKKNCRVSVTFTPTVLGPLTGTLTFTDNAPNSPQAVPLSGTGIEPATLTPTRATYAAQKVGTTSAAKKFTLTNNQTVTLTSIAITTNGPYAVSATTCTTSLAAKDKCTISVTFTPEATGGWEGQLVVNDSASSSPQISSLYGTGK